MIKIRMKVELKAWNRKISMDHLVIDKRRTNKMIRTN
jgi:hypothetical protein